MEQNNSAKTKIHQFVEDNPKKFNTAALHKDFKKLLFTYMGEELQSPYRDKHIIITERNNGAQGPIREIEVDKHAVEINEQTIQAFKRFFEKPQPYLDYNYCEKYEAQIRYIIPIIFVCWYLDRKNKDYIWNIFKVNGRLEDDYDNCLKIIIDSFPSKGKHVYKPIVEDTLKIHERDDKPKLCFFPGLQGWLTI